MIKYIYQKCENCEGTGQVCRNLNPWEIPESTCAQVTYWLTCPVCNGQGEVATEMYIHMDGQ